MKQLHLWMFDVIMLFYISLPRWPNVNPLKTKRRLLYLKTQSVPRSKHFSSRL